jgi:PBSX family phage terminase large subunit
MILTPSQATIAKDRHRFRVLNCGRRFGKTILAVEEMVGVAIKKKDRRVAYFAPTRDDAREITWALLTKKCENVITYKNESLLNIRIMTEDGGESTIALYGWESVQERGKGRGLANDLIICDEVSSYRNFWIGWNEVLSPTLLDRKGSAMFISTPKGFNHFYDLSNKELTDKDYKTFHFTSYDNPHIPVEEIEREKSSKPLEVFAQEYMASFQKTQGLVYKEFSREKHLYETLPEGTYEKLGGIDFGFKNPAGVLDIRYAKERFYVEDEWYKRERTEEQIADYVSTYKFDEVYPDPENPSAIEVLKNKNINVREVIKGKDSVKSGINKVREAFITGKLKINKRCVNLIAELEMYSYDDEKGDRNEDENPIKANDHLLDALRYVIMMKNVGVDMESEKAERLLSRLKSTQSQTR